MVETTQEPKPTKIDAVREILADGGKKTTPIEIANQAKERFGIELTTDYASKLKTQILGKRKKKKPAAPKEEVPPVPALLLTPPAAHPPNGKAVLLDDILALRGLVERIGADELRTLIDVMTGR